MQRPIGQYLDDPDALFNWLHSVVIGVPVLHFACQSGLAERVLQGPATDAELAQATGVAEAQVRRIADYLVAHEVAVRDAQGRLTAHRRMEFVLANAGLWQQMINTQWAASALHPALAQGRTGFEEKFGQPVFEWFADNPQSGALFGQFMSFMTARTVGFVLASHRFEPFERVVDIGGSHATLLLAVLEQYPGTSGVLFDLPGVAEQARAIVAASPLAERVEIVGGSFFDEVPAADLYLLKQILHDWSDEQSIAILRTVRQSIESGGRVAVIDHLLAEKPSPSEAQSTDVAMMVWATGRERTRADFENLFAQAGFRLDRITENPRGHSVIEGVPV